MSPRAVACQVGDPFALRERFPKIQCVDDSAWESHGYFNPNEHGPALRARVVACSRAYSRVLFYGRSTIRAVQNAESEGFQASLARIPPTRAQSLFLSFEHPRVLALFESFVIAGKTLLDVLCVLLAESAGKGITPRGFNKEERENRPNKGPGGRLQNALEASNIPPRDGLLDLIGNHRARWIDALVSMRDDVVHFGKLSALMPFWMVVHEADPLPRYGRKLCMGRMKQAAYPWWT
jgi:hypothetical protein